jgi:hypothetical protein
LDFCINSARKHLAITFDSEKQHTNVKTTNIDQTTRLLNSLYCLRTLATSTIQLDIDARNVEMEFKHIKQLVQITNICSLSLCSANFQLDFYHHLSGLSSLENLCLFSSSESINWLSTNLTALDVAFPKVKDWTPLTKLERLKKFLLRNTNNQPFSSVFRALHKLTALDTLSFHDSISTDQEIQSVCNVNYAHLTSLSIHHDELAPKTLFYIKKLTTLKKLGLTSTPEYYLSSLACLTNLTWLYLSTWSEDNKNIWDNKSLQSLSLLTKLKVLNFKTPPLIGHQSWLHGIGTITSLERLAIGFRCIDIEDGDLGYLLNLRVMTALRLGNPAKLTPKASDYFSLMTNLRSLWYSGQELNDVFSEIQKNCLWLDVRLCMRVDTEID